MKRSRSAAMRRLLIFPLMPLLLIGHYSGEPKRPVLGADHRIEAIAVPLDTSNPARDRIGPLRYLGGWELKGSDPAFGSFSAMVAEGEDLLFLSDAGGLVRFRIDAKGAIDRVAFTDLPDGPGRGWSKEDRDTEAMARDPETGKVWISFERSDAIWRYASDLSHAEARVQPSAMRDWPNNGGAEAMVRLRSGAFLVFSEAGKRVKDARAALRFDRDPTDPAAALFQFHYRPPPGYRVTDAVELGDGRILMLHRQVSLEHFLTAKLSVVDPADIRAGAIVAGREIATFEPPVIVDNMEALALTQENGRTILWMASDDNSRALFQRNLLLKFALEGEF